MAISINTKKIGTFLKSITEAEYIYMGHCMGMRDSIEKLIKRHKISKADFCKRFHIKPSGYNDFVKGNRNYTAMDMARLNSAFMELEIEQVKKNVPVQVAQSA